MNTALDVNSSHTQLAKYYRWHAKIYDVTRWLFLFGRSRFIRRLPELPDHSNILEVGCGTGKNLLSLAKRYPRAAITGADISSDMLDVACKKIQQAGLTNQIKLEKAAYGTNYTPAVSFNLILFSYSLTMMGGHKQPVLTSVRRDLKPTGHVAVIDFHKTPRAWFQKWMKINHVDLDGEAYTLLHSQFQPVRYSTKNAYGGWWSYFTYIGTKI